MTTINSFKELGLAPLLLSSLSQLGYETPTPIQSQSIPIVLNGDDLLAQAQTGTGKTAAFALPIISNIDFNIKSPQAIIIAPTRELALQVAEAFESYAKDMKDFHLASIYGGQSVRLQLQALNRGAQVIVGTPGRILYHLSRGTIKTEHLKTAVLDEADEMLKMGFIDDIESILNALPSPRQTALFSATMPERIKSVAKKYLSNPKRVHIESKTNTVEAIDQSCICVHRDQKLEVLGRILETDEVDAAIIFVRTKNDSHELALKLKARGYSANAINGNMDQNQREAVIQEVKNHACQILVATDVAARGIDIPRISHVINYDIPYDAESYIHRIGRTARAGRKGSSYLFVTPRELRLLKDIERTIKTPIKQVTPPSIAAMQDRRVELLHDKVMKIIVQGTDLSAYRPIIAKLMAQNNDNVEDIAAALSFLLFKDNPLPTAELKPASFFHDGNKTRSRDGFLHRKGQKRSGDGRRSDRKSNAFGSKSYGFSKRRDSDDQDRKPRRGSDKRSSSWSDKPGAKKSSWSDKPGAKKSSWSDKPGSKKSSWSDKPGSKISLKKKSSSGKDRNFSSDKAKSFGSAKKKSFSSAPRKTRKKF